MYFYIVEMFLVIEVFKLNNRMVGLLSLSLRKSTDVGFIFSAKSISNGRLATG